MTIFRLVGGTDVKPAGARSTPSRLEVVAAVDETLSVTAKNGRLREKRNQIWRKAEAATRYWRLRLKFNDVVSHAQRLEIPEGSYHPVLIKQKTTCQWSGGGVKHWPSSFSPPRQMLHR
jgi:hypothetical protein